MSKRNIVLVAIVCQLLFCSTVFSAGSAASPRRDDGSSASDQLEPAKLIYQGRLAVSHDGNIHDQDDWGALAFVWGIVASFGMQEKLVHVDHSDHLVDNTARGEKEMILSAEGWKYFPGFDSSVVFNAWRDLDGAIANFKKQAEAGSERDILSFMCAGPMDVPYRCINAVTPSKRKFIRVISHAGWNNKHTWKNPDGSESHTWDDMIRSFEPDGVVFVKIPVQNTYLGPHDSDWSFLNDMPTDTCIPASAWKWMFSREKKHTDVSDCGMTWWCLTGDANGNDKKFEARFKHPIDPKARTKADLYVSPSGNDSNPGTESAPFASLDRARLAVRELKQSKQGDIRVALKGGKYLLRDTVVFSPEDSGVNGQKIRYQALEGELPILTSEVPVQGWTKVDNPSKAFGQQVKDIIWSAPLPEGVGRIKYLFKGDKVLPRAMTKGFTPPVKYNSWSGSEPEHRQYMKVPEGIISDWTDVKDMELVIMPVCDWTVYNMPLDSYDSATHTMKTVTVSPKYALGAPGKRTWAGKPTAWFANCPEGMRQEGNWTVNTREQKIYLVSKQKPQEITVPTLLELVRVEGMSASDSEAQVLVENIHFQGLLFTKGKRMTMGQSSGSGSLLALINAKNCSVTQCRFEHSGGNAISLHQAAQHNRIEGNNVKRLGGSGISISGPSGPGNLSFGNQVIGNHVHHNGESAWGAPGISISGSSENLIAHNLVHHNPYNGMRLSGGTQGNVFEYNELHHAVEVLGDGNAFYIVTNQKNTIRYNYIHDMLHSHASGAIRTDGVGTSKNISFQGNILHRIINGGIQLKGFGHQAINNIFVDCCGNSENKTWEGGRGWLEIRCGPSQGTSLKNNIFFATFNRRPSFMNAVLNMPARFRNKGLDIEVDKIDQAGNICYSTIFDQSEGNAAIAGSKKLGFELEFKKFDAVSIKDGRVTLNPDSELFKQGYEYIDTSRIGLPATFPGQWRKYDPEMAQKKHFQRHD